MTAQMLSRPAPAARILTIDAGFCLATGTVLALFNAPLAAATGIPALALLVIGIGTAASGAFMAYVSRTPEYVVPVLKLALAVNVVWVVASVLVLLMGILPLTGMGVAGIIAVALVVEALSIAEWRALR